MAIIPEEALIILIFAAAALALLVYLHGSRTVRRYRQRIAADLEAVFQPQDPEYINIGGLIGYHANYTHTNLLPHAEKVEVTFTFLPRHSLLFYPLARLLGRRDRVYLTLIATHSLKTEAHLLRPAIQRNPRLRVNDTGAMYKQERILSGRQFLEFSREKGADDRGCSFLESAQTKLSFAHIKHLSIYENRFYLHLVYNPADFRKDIAAFRELFIDEIKNRNEL